MLDEEKYAGTQVYNRTSSKLGTKVRINPPSEWIRKPNAFPAIVDPEIFRRVQERRKAAHRRLSDKELLEMLRRLLAKRGRLTERTVIRDKSMPCMQTYAYRFGSLFNAFRLIGYFGNSKHAGMQERFRRRHLRTELSEEIRSAVATPNS